MAKRKSFSDDGWAIWVTGDDTSTFYLNEWVNPRGKSYVDISVRIRGVKGVHSLNVYVPFSLEKNEVEDLADHMKNESIFRAIFSTRCILDYLKNPCTSEMAYHGKTVDLVHISRTEYTVSPLADGTLLTVSIDALMEHLDNDEAYFIFRLPHKSLDELFRPQINVRNLFTRLRDLLTSPVLSEKYTCSVRVNEARLLPDVINQIGAFHRQKLNKVVLTLSLHEDYQVNAVNCYRIRRIEKDLYEKYAPMGFACDEAITYEWNETREQNFYGHFNFYFDITRETVSKFSVLLYVFLLIVIGWTGDLILEFLRNLHAG